jgi:hypothetical protein
MQADAYAPAGGDANGQREAFGILMVGDDDPALTNLSAICGHEHLKFASIGRVYVDFSIVDVEVDIRAPRDGVGLSPLIGMGDERGEREDKRQHVR